MHKADISQWTTIDQKEYKIQINNGPILDGEKAFENGSYTALMEGCPAYQKCKKLKNVCDLAIIICVPEALLKGELRFTP